MRKSLDHSWSKSRFPRLDGRTSLARKELKSDAAKPKLQTTITLRMNLRGESGDVRSRWGGRRTHKK